MRYYLDTEFYEDGHAIYPISLGLVREDYKELYMEFEMDFFYPPDHWICSNVIPHLTWPEDKLMARSEGAKRIEEFVGDDPNVEVWAYFADYDWVLFCQLFGTMLDLPKNFPMFCMDLKQYWVHLGRPEKARVNPPAPANAHNALADARWNKQFHDNLRAWSTTRL